MTTIDLHAAVARSKDVAMHGPADFALQQGEHIAIVGANAAGKTLLVDLITGKTALGQGTLSYDFGQSAARRAYGNIRYIAFRDTYGSADATYYYQQRWNATDIDEAPLVRTLLEKQADEASLARLCNRFGFSHLLDKPIILLSSGELRKFQIIKMLATQPRVLIMDNPYIGLDASARQLLTELFAQLTEQGNIQLVLVLSAVDTVPPFITHVVPVAGMQVGQKLTRDDYLDSFSLQDPLHRQQEQPLYDELRRQILSLPYMHRNFEGEEVVRLNKVSIRYGERTILKELDWVVRRGERWALSGDNGSGKSTLLSLICADNPQSYACDISLFGRKRGTGESIWEIKRHIGYVSPEMHRAYCKNLPAINIVASGLHDTIGLYAHSSEEQLEVCRWWMRVFGIAPLEQRSFMTLSSGEQRLVLLARAFVKDPELLILDEPLHGLDTYNRRKVKQIIKAFCDRRDKTLIMVTHYQEELPDSITHQLHLQ